MGPVFLSTWVGSFTDENYYGISNELKTGLVSFSERSTCQIGVFWWHNTTNSCLLAEYYCFKFGTHKKKKVTFPISDESLALPLRHFTKNFFRGVFINTLVGEGLGWGWANQEGVHFFRFQKGGSKKNKAGMRGGLKIFEGKWESLWMTKYKHFTKNSV